MSNLEEELQRIFADAKLRGIDLTPPPPKPSASTAMNHLQAAFEELQHFVDENGREPIKGKGSMIERKLAARLASFRMTHPDELESLRPYDRHGLLPEPPKSIDDVFSDKAASSIFGSRVDIFNTASLPQKTRPEYVAKRKPCADFEYFKPLFEACHRELEERKRLFFAVARGAKNDINQGDFVLLQGMLGYVAEKGEMSQNQRGETNCRLRVIYENGTESDQMMRSLFADLYKHGKLISGVESQTLNLGDEGNEGMEIHDSAEDVVAGTIYILRSLSDNPQIRRIPNLYKIGLTAESLQSRIANAEQEPTYLMAKVEIVKSFTCYNLVLHKMENLLHRFFGGARMEIAVVDKHGNTCRPREWFSVPLPAIEEAIAHLVQGDIIQYRYEPTSGRVLPKTQ